jgi:hypothetical protein
MVLKKASTALMQNSDHPFGWWFHYLASKLRAIFIALRQLANLCVTVKRHNMQICSMSVYQAPEEKAQLIDMLKAAIIQMGKD